MRQKGGESANSFLNKVAAVLPMGQRSNRNNKDGTGDVCIIDGSAFINLFARVLYASSHLSSETRFLRCTHRSVSLRTRLERVSRSRTHMHTHTHTHARVRMTLGIKHTSLSSRAIRREYRRVWLKLSIKRAIMWLV